MKVVGVRFQSSGRIYYFDPLEYTFSEGDGVIVETARGQEYGVVTQAVTEVEDTVIVSPLKPVVRPATEQDLTMREQNSAKEGDAFRICQKKIEQHGLDMHLVRAEYSFNGSKLVFYFTADERVDFRELVKDLAAQFRTRIELRQIGVRDEAKMIGGLGACGRPVCCKAFLDDFHPVSIKMAKEQNLSLSPTKISGLCGRLMCCLQYEQAAYEEMKKKMPRVNHEVLTPDGVGTVVENNVITEKTKVRLPLPDGTIDVREYHYTAIGRVGEPLPVPEKRPEDEAKKADWTEAAYGQTPADAAPAGTGAPAHTEPRSGNSTEKKRHRRGGRGRGGNRTPAKDAGSESGAANQQNGRPQNKPAQNAQQTKDRGGAEGKQTNGTGNANPKPKSGRRHHRGGGNRPRPEGTTPAKTE